MKRYLFVDRDGTLIAEPPDHQVDSITKFALMPNVIPALLRCVASGFELVMVSNQDGLGTAAFPQADFDGPQGLFMNILESQGIRFHEVLVDTSLPEENEVTRKPDIGLVRHYLAADNWNRVESAVVGDRETDTHFAEALGVRGFRLGGEQGWLDIAHALCDRPRRADRSRVTRETRIRARVDLDASAKPRVATGIGFFDHMLEQFAT